MSKLRVAWDNCFARRNEGGTGVYAARILEQLEKQPDLRINVLEGRQRLLRDGRLRRMLRTGHDLFWTHVRLPAILWKGGFDLLHAPAFIAPITTPCPVIITIHDITYLLYPSHFSRPWILYMRSIMPPAVKNAAAIICGSEHSKRDIARAYRLDPSRIHVIPYGVDLARFRPTALMNHEWARGLGIREGYILHVGALSYRKNIPTLLRAVAVLRSKRNWWGSRQLVLAGTESPGLPGGDEIHKTIEQLDLAEHVVLAGRVPDDCIPGLYAHASMLAMPSLYEGFGFPILESMACGTPVVASNTSSLPEVAGNAAILVPPGDEHAFAESIECVIKDPPTAKNLRDKGLLRARSFSWERAAVQTARLYRAVAK